MKRFCLLVSMFLFSSGAMYGNNSYSEYWQEATWTQWKKGPFQLSAYARFDSRDQWKGIRAYMLNEQFAYQALKNLAVCLGYRYVHGRNVVPGSIYRWQHRFELEINPAFPTFHNSAIVTRNRFEMRKEEGVPDLLYRFRQRTMWVVTLEDIKWLKSFSFSNEAFYDISRHRFEQDRFCPCIFTFPIYGQVSLDAYFMVRFFLHEEIWRQSYVLGTHLHF